jgi:hypothetical protein
MTKCEEMVKVILDEFNKIKLVSLSETLYEDNMFRGDRYRTFVYDGKELKVRWTYVSDETLMSEYSGIPYWSEYSVIVIEYLALEMGLTKVNDIRGTDGMFVDHPDYPDVQMSLRRKILDRLTPIIQK